MTDLGRAEVCRRFLIAFGVGRYHDSRIADLPGAPADARRLTELLLPMGYKAVLTELADVPAKDVEEKN